MLNNDHDIVEALLRRDEQITREFFYRKCYPLFKSVYDNYHTDCALTFKAINANSKTTVNLKKFLILEYRSNCLLLFELFFISRLHQCV